LRQGLLDLTQLLALLRQFVSKGEDTTLPRLIRGKPPLVLRQPLAITFPLLLKPVEGMLEAGDGPEWRDSDSEINLAIRAVALEQGLMVVIVAPAMRSGEPLSARSQ